MSVATSKDGTKITYIRSGKGPVVVLVGGALQLKADQLMGGLTPLLSKSFTVVSYDRRGRGESGDTDPYAVEREIEDLDAVIKANGDSAYVFGMSSGGILALLADTKLKNITKLATYEAPFIKAGGSEEYITELKQAVADGKSGKAVKLFMKRIGMPGPMIFMMSLMPMWPQLKKLAPTLIYDALITGDGSTPKELTSISVPTLLVTGTTDTMKSAAATVANVIPTSRQQVLEGQTHNVKAEALAPALEVFFKEK